MKTLRIILTTLALSIAAFAWNCPAGQIRQQAPAGTSTTAPYYDVVEGIAFICVSSTPTATPGSTSTLSNTLSTNNTNLDTAVNTNLNTAVNTNTNTANSTSNSLSNSLSNSTSSASQQQQQKQSQSQVATGGDSTAVAYGGTASAKDNGNGNGNNSNDSTTNIAAPKIPVSSAITPPIMPTVPCFKGIGGSVQTMAFGGSFGAGKVDQGCDDRELARAFSGPQTVASCKILLNTKKAKKAGITMEDCLNPKEPIVVASMPELLPVPAVPTTIIVPAPVVNVQPILPVLHTELTVEAPKPVKKHHRKLPPNCQNVTKMVCASGHEK